MAAPQSTLEIHGRKTSNKYAYLFISLLLVMAAFPYVDRPGLPSALFRLAGAVAFLAAVYAVSEKRAQWITALVLWCLAGSLNTVLALHPNRRIAIPALVSTILFLGFTLVSLLRDVLRTKVVNRDTIYGAITVYLLIAYVWGAAYLLLETLQPGALALNTTWHPNHSIDWPDCMFFSFVTLTSVGYGDMIPITAQ